jgi:hypothetical protein
MKVQPKTLALGILIILISVNFLSILTNAGSELASDPPAVSAQGPYGTSDEPFYEGETINFEADILNADASDYYFRWDVNNDGTWEKDDFGTLKGNPTYAHAYRDDYEGLSKVEAWDGESYRPQWEDGSVFEENLQSNNVPIGSSIYKTVGMKFCANSPIIINQLGIYNDADDPYILIFNVRLWTQSGKLVQSFIYPIAPAGSWTWFDIVPLSVDTDECYIVTMGFNGELVATQDNPVTSNDGKVETQDFLLLDGTPFGFPTSSYSTSILPMVDIGYSYSIPVPDIKEDTASVFVTNAQPLVEAGVDFEIMVNDPALFTGGFFDPGLDDTHEIEWDFGDGNKLQGTLTPSHTYSKPGVYTVTLTVTDDDGGVGSDTITVSVLKPKTVKDLIFFLKDTIFDLDLPHGLEKSMVSSLSNALSSFEKGNKRAAENKIHAFILHVKAQKGKKIRHHDANAIIDSALEIIDKISS